MKVEQRLAAAFRQADRVEPSPDLWSRVVHSIDEDRRHRMRVRLAMAAVAATALGLIAVGAASLRADPRGQFVHRPTLALLELGGLVCLAVVLGPAIRRFGRGYAGDLWAGTSPTPTHLLRLLDLAYYLVISGYILVSTRFEFADGGSSELLTGQLQQASGRLGGLLLVTGLLHAVTLMALPLVALIDNTTRVGRPLPRWIVIGLTMAGIGGALVAVPLMGLLMTGAS